MAIRFGASKDNFQLRLPATTKSVLTVVQVLHTVVVQVLRFKVIHTAGARVLRVRPVSVVARESSLEPGSRTFSSDSNSTLKQVTIHNRVSIRLDLPKRVAEELSFQRRERCFIWSLVHFAFPSLDERLGSPIGQHWA